MKYLLLLFLTFNSFAQERMIMTDLRNNSQQGSEVFETKALAVERLVEISKIKNGWRTGIFNFIELDSLYSKVEDVITREDLGNVQPIFEYDEITGERGEKIGEQPIIEEVITPTTFYYHPVNWSYSLTDVSEEMKAKAIEQAINKAIERKLACGNSTIKYVAKSNIKKNLNKAQRKQMVLGFSEIFDLLKSGSVDIAKDEIALVEADGVIVTEQDKTNTIAFITGCE